MSSNGAPQSVWLMRHGPTEWSESGQHTGNTDVPLTERGEAAAKALGPILARQSFARVMSSPLSRARRTAELAGLTPDDLDPDLCEWDYGDYEGRTTPDIRETVPGWTVWRDGCPNGEIAGGAGSTARSSGSKRSTATWRSSPTGTFSGFSRHGGSGRRRSSAGTTRCRPLPSAFLATRGRR